MNDYDWLCSLDVLGMQHNEKIYDKFKNQTTCGAESLYETGNDNNNNIISW